MNARIRTEWRNKAPLIGIIDDEESVRVSIGSLIRSAGFRTAAFASAEIFLCSETMQHTRCLISDLRMPGLSGLELQRRLSDLRCSIPVIFVTAHADAQERSRALQQGAVAFLDKPFSDSILFDALRAALAKSTRVINSPQSGDVPDAINNCAL